MARTTKTETPVNPPATFSPEALAALLNEVSESRKLMTAQMAEITQLKADVAAKAPAKVSMAGKTMQQVKNELAVIKAFKAKGFGNVTPHKDVKTFNRWVAEGFRPVEGSKSLKVSNLRLFHKSQCRPITAEEKAASAEQSKAAMARKSKGGVVVPIGASPQ
jgi:hypothetical protein